jgi:hypothetical protein
MKIPTPKLADVLLWGVILAVLLIALALVAVGQGN